MRLDLLLKRENFPRVFERSFARYLLQAFGVDAAVNWGRNPVQDRTALLVNRKLNVIYSKDINRAELRFIASEYAYHPNLVKRFLQTVYIRLATCVYFERLFVKERVGINPWIKDLDKLCVIPGNQSIRVINFEACSCTVFVKYGFDVQLIKNEVRLREAYDFLPIPRLLHIDPEYLYYQEERIKALPLNRLGSPGVANKALLQAQQCLLSLYGKTLEKSGINSYLESLYASCDQYIATLPKPYTQTDKVKIKQVLEQLSTTLVGVSSNTIDLVQSHGDLQAANILVSNFDQQLYLIDWEYTAKRSIYYDALVFATQCRSPQGLSKRIKVMKDQHNFSWNWCINNAQVELLDTVLVIFLLEDLILRLSELQIPAMISKDEGLNIWMNEIEQMDWLIAYE